MKITTVVPFSTEAPSDDAKINRRTAAPAPVTDPTELAANAAALELERRRIKEDSEALQLREENLREYEARLRALQTEMDTGRGGRLPAARSHFPRGVSRLSLMTTPGWKPRGRSSTVRAKSPKPSRRISEMTVSRCGRWKPT